MAPEAGPPTPPPEAELVRLAREAQRISPETAAARAETQLSGSRWRQIEAGWRKDTKTVVIAKAATLAHMAYAVGVSPERLEAAGRNDAAAVAIRKAYGDDNSALRVVVAYARIMARIGHADEAIKAITTLGGDNPVHPELRYLLADIKADEADEETLGLIMAGRLKEAA